MLLIVPLLTCTVQIEHHTCIVRVGNSAHHHPAASADSSSCGSATDFTTTGREVSGSSGPGSCPSSRSASAAAARPGAQQVLPSQSASSSGSFLYALPPRQLTYAARLNAWETCCGDEDGLLARWRSVCRGYASLVNVLGCTAASRSLRCPNMRSRHHNSQSVFCQPEKCEFFVARLLRIGLPVT